MSDRFFTAKHCDRCGASLEGGRIMSMFNTDCICMDCHKKERELPKFKHAVDAEFSEIRRGNYNFKGIGYPAEVDAKMKYEPLLETVCPKCGEVYSGHPALSRENNRTLICPDCGTKEALASLAICEDEQEYILGIIHTHSN